LGPFFVATGADNVSVINLFIASKKSGFEFVFTQNTFRIVINLLMALKIPKNHFEIKNQIELVYVFS
jgi:hypothetical protein